ncbi:MAG: cytochrome c biogenesis protein CcdA, partial [bacterium]|nr:cytochrome c biogenesis protein CcdA [bacterium]
PSYFAYAFKSKVDILKVTTIFAAGVAVVIVPIGIGIAALASFFSLYHEWVFFAGGSFLVFLGALSLLGKTFELPFAKTSVKWNPQDKLSVFILGVFSGAASSCCAPVLAGVLTLTAISATLIQAGILALVYVFGMVFPLFVMAYFWDSYQWSKSPLVRGKILHFKLFGKDYQVHTTNLIAGVMFLFFGIFVIYLGITGTESAAPGWQRWLSSYVAAGIENVAAWSKGFPDFIFLVILGLIAALFIYKGFFSKVKRPEGGSNDSSRDR